MFVLFSVRLLTGAKNKKEAFLKLKRDKFFLALNTKLNVTVSYADVKHVSNKGPYK